MNIIQELLENLSVKLTEDSKTHVMNFLRILYELLLTYKVHEKFLTPHVQFDE